MPTSIKAPEPFSEHLSHIGSLLRAAPHVLLFLDFDGTLAPIVEHPDKARMPQETKQLLSRFARDPTFTLAIVSGRELSDLRTRVGLENVIYAGNHGLEISGPGIEFVEPVAAGRLKALGELSRHLRSRLRSISGVKVENKVFSASVHFRSAPPSKIPEVRKTVDAAVIFEGHPFRVTEGRKVYEIRPSVAWDKGEAVRWIQKTAGRQTALPVYIGDDSSDEDAFQALDGGLTISVGKRGETAASYFLERQEEVVGLLSWLLELDNSAQNRSTCRPRSSS